MNCSILRCCASIDSNSLNCARQQRGKVLRDPLDVFHQRGRIVKGVLVDTLQNVANRYAGAVEGGAIRLVDVAAPVGNCLAEFAVDGKLGRDFAEVALLFEAARLCHRRQIRQALEAWALRPAPWLHRPRRRDSRGLHRLSWCIPRGARRTLLR